MKKLLSLLLAMILCCMLPSFALAEDAVEQNVIHATIIMESGEEIHLELYPDVAPIAVANFVMLAQDGFYDGVIFHRVIEGFMIQGGSTLGTDKTAPYYGLPGEFAANGYENNLKHERGVISMARRTDDPDSASSQFFIMHEDAPSLDGEYAAFGRVVDEESMAVVDAIATTPTDDSDKPLTDQRVRTVTTDAPAPAEPVEPLPTVTITMETGEEIHLELYPHIAPNTVANFITLAQEGFYDGLKFHRVIEGFVIQSGCPRGDGYGGPGHAIKGEFITNGFANRLKHERGVISMARSYEADSAGSQFFIMHQTDPGLDGLYAAFGRVTDEESLAVIDAIATTPTNDYDQPETDWVIESVTVETHGVEYIPEIIENVF